VAALIRVDAVWLATEPIDMRAGTETALARVVKVFGAAHPDSCRLAKRRWKVYFCVMCVVLNNKALLFRFFLRQ